MTPVTEHRIGIDRRGLLRMTAAASLGMLLPSCSEKPVAAEPPSPPKPPKKGFCITTKNPGWQDRLRSLDANWFYSWGAPIPESIPAGISFIPMIWGKWKNPESLRHYTDAAKAGGITELLGFNEPDQKHQSAIPVAKALEAWPLLMESGMRLGSPGCVHADGDWMKEFMDGVDQRGLRVDFVCVHSYHGPSADALVERLEKLHDMFRRPIWITEFAVGDWTAQSAAGNRHKPGRILQFMEAVLPRLEQLDFIERYAWFSANKDSAALGTSALFEPDGSLTRLGECYRDFPSNPS